MRSTSYITFFKMNIEEEEPTPVTTGSLANRHSTQLSDPDASFSDEDQDAFESDQESEQNTKKYRGQEKLYTKVITLPDFDTAEEHIKTNFSSYRFRYEIIFILYFNILSQR